MNTITIPNHNQVARSSIFPIAGVSFEINNSQPIRKALKSSVLSVKGVMAKLGSWELIWTVQNTLKVDGHGLN